MSTRTGTRQCNESLAAVALFAVTLSIDEAAFHGHLQQLRAAPLRDGGARPDRDRHWMSVQAFQQAQGHEQLCWIDGAAHTDLYDKEPYVGQAVARLAEFFTKNLP